MIDSFILRYHFEITIYMTGVIHLMPVPIQFDKSIICDLLGQRLILKKRIQRRQYLQKIPSQIGLDNLFVPGL